jgi:hypothetical protein
MDRRSILGSWAVALVAVPAFARLAPAAGEKKHRLALHVDQSDIAQMNLALGNASNVSSTTSHMARKLRLRS